MDKIPKRWLMKLNAHDKKQLEAEIAHKKEIMIEPKISCLLKFVKSRLLFLMSK